MDITELISVHDSIKIIILLSFGTLFIHIWPWMTAQQLFLSKLALFALHDGICGSFHKKTTEQNLDEDSLNMLYKDDC